MATARHAADPGSTVLRLLMLVAVYALPAVVTLRAVGSPVLDPDIWWHLRAGQWVVEQHNVPDLDPFSQMEKPWLAYSWLYEVTVFGLFQAFGLAGIVAYRVGMALAIAAALHRLMVRREPRFLVATGLTAVGLLAMAMLFSERPWLLTILFSMLTLSTILDLREGRPSWLAFLLPLVFVVWANVHIQFIYGLGLLDLACLAPLLDRWLCLRTWVQPGDKARSEPCPPDAGPADQTAAIAWTPTWRRLVLLTLLCHLATLVNPYGVWLYQVVVEYAMQPGPFRFVNELKALEFREPSDWVMLALAAAATFALGRRLRPSTFDVLLLAIAAVFAFRARRDLWLLVLASLVVLTPPGRCVEPAEQFPLTRARLGWVALGVALVMAVTAWVRDLSPRSLEEKVTAVFPRDAAAYVTAHELRGPLFNDFNWGGYLIWTLPQLPVAIDGRTNLHGDERILRFGSTWAGAPGWDSDPDLTAAGVVVAATDSALAALLACDHRFHCVYQDEVAKVFIRAKRP